MDSKEEQLLREVEQEFKQEEEEEGHDYEKHNYDDNNDNYFHVLAVDDSLIDRKILEKLLTLSSFHVTCVESGDKALEYLGLVDVDHHQTPSIIDDIDHLHDHHNHHDDHHSNIHHSRPPPHDHHQQLSWKKKGEGARVNLIMTDYSMPGITGYDLLKRVKRSSWKDVPVVVMSSENVPSRIHMCLEEGADEFLLKPVRLSDLKKLHPHLLKSTTSTQCCGNNTRKRSYSKELLGESSRDLEANDILNYDYKQEEIVIRELSSCFDKGKAKIDDDQHFDRRVKLEGLTASVSL